MQSQATQVCPSRVQPCASLHELHGVLHHPRTDKLFFFSFFFFFFFSFFSFLFFFCLFFFFFLFSFFFLFPILVVDMAHAERAPLE